MFGVAAPSTCNKTSSKHFFKASAVIALQCCSLKKQSQETLQVHPHGGLLDQRGFFCPFKNFSSHSKCDSWSGLLGVNSQKACCCFQFPHDMTGFHHCKMWLCPAVLKSQINFVPRKAATTILVLAWTFPQILFDCLIVPNYIPRFEMNQLVPPPTFLNKCAQSQIVND